VVPKSRHSKQYARLLTGLREAREAARITQVDAATSFGKHASFISKCESGERRIDVVELAAFCRLYRVGLAAFLKSVGLE
jgi:transcriptional regulator with XRE-family HTH domain